MLKVKNTVYNRQAKTESTVIAYYESFQERQFPTTINIS